MFLHEKEVSYEMMRVKVISIFLFSLVLIF